MTGGPGEGGPAAYPPGWYVDPTGTTRWWDGATWQAAPAAAPDPSSPAIGALAHLSLLLSLGLVVPLVLWAIMRDKDRSVRAHAAEAANFHITMLVAAIPGVLVYFLGFASLVTTGTRSPTGRSGAPPPDMLPLLLGMGWLVLVAGLAFVCALIAGVRAAQRRFWRYPVSLRLIDKAFLAEVRSHGLEPR